MGRHIDVTRPVLGSRAAVVLDVETTGLNPDREEIVELAMVLFHFDGAGRIDYDTVQEYSGLREPSIPIPTDATRVHGITDRDVRGRRLNHKKIQDFMQQAQYVIAHNVDFDRPFVERLFPDVFGAVTWLCTMRDVDWHKRGVAHRRLATIARFFKIEHRDAHRALGDARATFGLLSLANSHGETVLQELLRRRVRRHARARLGPDPTE